MEAQTRGIQCLPSTSVFQVQPTGHEDEGCASSVEEAAEDYEYNEGEIDPAITRYQKGVELVPVEGRQLYGEEFELDNEDDTVLDKIVYEPVYHYVEVAQTDVRMLFMPCVTVLTMKSEIRFSDARVVAQEIPSCIAVGLSTLNYVNKH